LADKITIRQRAAAAWRVAFGHADDLVGAYSSFYRNGKAVPASKAAPFAWPSWRSGKPAWQIADIDAYIKDGFSRNSIIYSAIMYKYRAMMAAPLRAYTGEADHPEPLPADAPLAKLIARPNEHQSMIELHGQNIVYLNVAGNCYQYFDRPSPGALPTAIYSLRPDRVFVVPGGKSAKMSLAGFLYVPEGKSAWGKMSMAERRGSLDDGRALPILPEDIMHTKLPNPGDPLEGMGYGLSPIRPGAYSADLDNALTDYLNLFFKHGGVPPLAFSFASAITDKMMAYLRERLSDEYGGYVNWIKPIVLDEGGKVERIGLAFDELGSKGLDMRNETRILGPFGVPAILVGAQTGLENATYSNLEGLRRLFWQDTMVPETRLFEIDYKYFLRDRDGRDWAEFDFSDVPALKQDIGALTEAAERMWRMSTPASIAYATVGLPVPRYEGDEISYVSMGLYPAGGEMPAPNNVTESGAASATDEPRKMLGIGDSKKKDQSTT